MKKGVKISIVILSTLRYEKTKKCISKIFENTIAPFEIIVVDQKGGKRIIKWFKKVSKEKRNFKFIHLEKDYGTTSSRNKGVKLTKGKYIVFMDNDMITTPKWDVELVKVAENNPEVAIVGAKILRMNENVYYCSKYMYAKRGKKGGIIEIGLNKTRTYHKNNANVNHQEEVPWYPTTTLLIKKKVFEKVGGFDTSFRIANEDKDLCLKIRKAGYKIVYCPKAVVYHDHDYASIIKGKKDNYHKRFRLRLSIIKKDGETLEKKWKLKIVDTW